MKKSIKNIDVRDKTVIVRVDFNVPMKDGEISSDFRIRAAVPTINFLNENGAKRIILISHLGRPDGKKSEELSLRPVADKLSEILDGITVSFVDEISGAKVKEAVNDLKDGNVLLLENLRFSPLEEENSLDFAKEIVESTGADIFVQDGFAVVHRAHASTDAITKLLPAYSGLLLDKEIEALSKVRTNPDKPLCVIIGGAKVKDKQPLIDEFLPMSEYVLVGGKIASDGYESTDKKIIVADDFDIDAEGNKLDCGPVSTSDFVQKIMKCKTVIWNGLLGKAEDPAYATSSTIIAKVLGENPDIMSVVCGGDTAGFVESLIKKDKNLKYSLISTGGGASLDYLSGKKLPGLDALTDE